MSFGPGFPSPAASLIIDASTGQLSYQAAVPLRLTVGFHPVTLYAAGQWANAPYPIEAACQLNYYGHQNETCCACPTIGGVAGAACAGFNSSETSAAARYPYPVPQAGFFNLNDTMASACPAGNLDPCGRVCIVACVPSSACLADNVCAAGYVSKPPLYRCASCAPGFYPTGGVCTLCPTSPYAIVVIFVLAVVFGAVFGYVLNRWSINIAFFSIGLDFMQVGKRAAAAAAAASFRSTPLAAIPAPPSGHGHVCQR